MLSLETTLTCPITITMGCELVLFFHHFFHYESHIIRNIYMLSFVELLSGLCLYSSPCVILASYFFVAFMCHPATCCASIGHNTTNKC